MDTQTRHALKKDKFAQATASSVSWLSLHRAGAIQWAVGAVASLALAIAGLWYYNSRSDAAASALGAALDVYNAPLAQPGLPKQANEYDSAAERSKAANEKFLAVAKQFSWFPEGAKAHYFAGVTEMNMGQNAAAESELKAAAGRRDRELSNLANLALAGLYHRTGRDSQAIEIYNAVIARPSETVPASVAQLDLADLYAATGKQDLARALWAKVKDADKDGAAGAAAAQKLAAKQ